MTDEELQAYAMYLVYDRACGWQWVTLPDMTADWQTARLSMTEAEADWVQELIRTAAVTVPFTLGETA